MLPPFNMSKQTAQKMEKNNATKMAKIKIFPHFGPKIVLFSPQI